VARGRREGGGSTREGEMQGNKVGRVNFHGT
jgi:hypothetical protein